MGSFTYQEKAIDAVLEENNKGNSEERKRVTAEDLYVVWFCKTLGNWKALISTDKFNGVYWEVTYNGAKDEAYVDRYVYVKANNVAVKV